MTVSIRQVEGLDDPECIVKRSSAAADPKAVKILTEFATLSSSVYIGTVDDQIACVWGFIRPYLLSQEAYLWLLTTELVEEHKFLFVRHSQRHIEQMLKQYPLIVGDCVVGDYKAMKWLRLLGAVFSEPEGKKISFTIKAKSDG